MNLPTPTTTVMEDHAAANREPVIALPVDHDVAAAANTPRATELPYGSPAFRDVPSKDREGHLFLGCMCDMRRAVIVVDTISIILAVIQFILALVVLVNFDDIKQYTDETDNDTWSSLSYDTAKVILGAIIFLTVMAIIFFSMGIYGAREYNLWLVATAMGYHCITLVLHFFYMCFGFSAWSVFGLLFSALFLYPHISLFVEMKNGIITPDNYVNEKSTCCCA